MQVADRVERVNENITNVYLVEEDGRVTVVDAGMPGNWDIVMKGLARIGRTLADVEGLVLTHAHADHMGVAERIRVGAPCEAHIHEADHEYAISGKRPPGGMDRGFSLRLVNMLAYGIRKRGTTLIPVAEARAFANGDVLDLPGSPRIVHAPGHTPGSCAILFEERGALMAGDTIGTVDVISGKTGPRISPFYTDKAMAIASLARLDGLPARIVLPGHGDPFEGTPSQAVALARAAAGA